MEAATIMTEMAGPEAAMHYHLTANHFPPVPESMVPVALKAVELAAEGDWDAELFLPDGIVYRDRFTAPVHAIVEQHHLEAFVEVALGGEEE
jgi:hypothetical protein